MRKRNYNRLMTTNKEKSNENVFSEESANCTITPIKKKLDNANEEVKKKEANLVQDTLRKDAGIKTTESEPCSCIYQHAREIAERKKETLEHPPCPCLLNSRRKWDTCPCLTKCKCKQLLVLFKPFFNKNLLFNRSKYFE